MFERMSICVVTFGVLAACSVSPEKVAANACPIVSRTAVDNEVAIIKAFEESGMSREQAVATSDRYVRIAKVRVFGQSSADVCKAAALDDKGALATFQKRADEETALQERIAETKAGIQRAQERGQELEKIRDINSRTCAIQGFVC